MRLKTNLLLLFLFLGTTVLAQSDKFGTYYNQRRTLFELLPDTKKEILLFVNAGLKKWCAQNGFHYVDIYRHLLSPGTDLLHPEFTNDGLHLLGAGYLKWVEVVKPLL